MSDETAAGSNLGSLAQNARRSELKNARTIMILVGILTIGINAAGYAMSENLVNESIDAEVRKVQGQGMMVDQAAVAEIRESSVRTAHLLSGVMAGVGVLFVVMGIVIYTKPVPITIVALVIYVGAWAIFGYLDPSSIANGIILRLLVVIGLAKAVQAAIAYERERAALAATAAPEKFGFES